MADQDISTVADSEQTPASTESVETPEHATPAAEPTQTEAVEAENALDTDDPWADAIAKADKDDTDDDEPEKPAETPAKPEKETEKEEQEGEKPLEDQVLEEAFAETEEETPETKDEFLDKQDPKDMIAGQRNATVRAWAERNQTWAEPVKAMRNPEIPISEVATKLEEVHAERYEALQQHVAHKLVDTNPEGTFRRAYAVKMLQKDPTWNPQTGTFPSLDELIANADKTPATTQADALPETSEISEFTAELDKAIDWDWRNPELDTNFVDDRERMLASNLRSVEAKLKKEAIEKSALVAEKQALAEKVSTFEKDLNNLTTLATSQTEQKVEEIKQSIVSTYRQSISDKLLPFALKSTGLEISENDTPKIKAFKEQRQQLYTGTAYEKANNVNSAFEAFAYNESSVRSQIETVITRLLDAQDKEAKATVAKNAADVAKYRKQAEDERIPLFQLMAQATKEFKKARIDPDLELLNELSGRLAKPIEEASQRIEVVSNGASAGSHRAPKVDYATAEDVWAARIEQAQREDALGAAG